MITSINALHLIHLQGPGSRSVTNWDGLSPLCRAGPAALPQGREQENSVPRGLWGLWEEPQQGKEIDGSQSHVVVPEIMPQQVLLSLLLSSSTEITPLAQSLLPGASNSLQFHVFPFAAAWDLRFPEVRGGFVPLSPPPGSPLLTHIPQQGQPPTGNSLEHGLPLSFCDSRPRFSWYHLFWRVVRHWRNLPRKVVQAPSLEVLQARLHGGLNNLV